MTTKFGRYELVERISMGGMAEVFKARVLGTAGFEKIVAIKRILPELSNDEEFVRMFIEEAKMSANLNHSNIGQVLEFGHHENSYFIALEYIHGKDLRKINQTFSSNNDRMPIPMAIRVVLDVCNALEYAHAKRDASGELLRIVHRDISPQNILVSFEGAVKLIDFGIAKALANVVRSSTGNLRGKFSYMSPEQVDSGAVDNRSDIFALGVVFWESLTGTRLFQGDNDLAILSAVRQADIKLPSRINPFVSGPLDEIVAKALARKPEDRFQRAEDFHEALERFAQSARLTFNSKQLSRWMKNAYAAELGIPPENDEQTSNLRVTPSTVPQPISREARTTASPRRTLPLAVPFLGGKFDKKPLAPEKIPGSVEDLNRQPLSEEPTDTNTTMRKDLKAPAVAVMKPLAGVGADQSLGRPIRAPSPAAKFTPPPAMSKDRPMGAATGWAAGREQHPLRPEMAEESVEEDATQSWMPGDKNSPIDESDLEKTSVDISALSSPPKPLAKREPSTAGQYQLGGKAGVKSELGKSAKPAEEKSEGDESPEVTRVVIDPAAGISTPEAEIPQSTPAKKFELPSAPSAKGPTKPPVELIVPVSAIKGGGAAASSPLATPKKSPLLNKPLPATLAPMQVAKEASEEELNDVNETVVDSGMELKVQGLRQQPDLSASKSSPRANFEQFVKRTKAEETGKISTATSGAAKMSFKERSAPWSAQSTTEELESTRSAQPGEMEKSLGQTNEEPTSMAFASPRPASRQHPLAAITEQGPEEEGDTATRRLEEDEVLAEMRKDEAAKNKIAAPPPSAPSNQREPSGVVKSPRSTIMFGSRLNIPGADGAPGGWPSRNAPSPAPLSTEEYNENDQTRDKIVSDLSALPSDGQKKASGPARPAFPNEQTDEQVMRRASMAIIPPAETFDRNLPEENKDSSADFLLDNATAEVATEEVEQSVADDLAVARAAADAMAADVLSTIPDDAPKPQSSFVGSLVESELAASDHWPSTEEIPPDEGELPEAAGDQQTQKSKLSRGMRQLGDFFRLRVLKRPAVLWSFIATLALIIGSIVAVAIFSSSPKEEASLTLDEKVKSPATSQPVSPATVKEKEEESKTQSPTEKSSKVTAPDLKQAKPKSKIDEKKEKAAKAAAAKAAAIAAKKAAAEEAKKEKKAKKAALAAAKAAAKVKKGKKGKAEKAEKVQIVDEEDPKKKPAPPAGEKKSKAAAKKSEESGKDKAAAKGGKTGMLIIASKPVARIVINGKDTGRSTPVPPSSPLTLPPGNYKVTLVVDKQKFTFPVTIKAEEMSRLVKTLPVE